MRCASAGVIDSAGDANLSIAPPGRPPMTRPTLPQSAGRPGRIGVRVALLGLLAGASVGVAAAEHAPKAGDPSTDWRDQVLYLAMIDCFENGNPGNDDQGAGEFDPADLRKFSGGDLAGVERRLDDVQGGLIGPAGPPTIAFCRSPGRADAL